MTRKRGKQEELVFHPVRAQLNYKAKLAQTSSFTLIIGNEMPLLYQLILKSVPNKAPQPARQTTNHKRAILCHRWKFPGPLCFWSKNSDNFFLTLQNASKIYALDFQKGVIE